MNARQLLGCFVVAVTATLVGCAAPESGEAKGSSASDWRIGPVIRGPGSLPKMQPRAPLPKEADPCDVARGAARGDGCSGNPGDRYVPAAQCDSSADETCPSSNVRPGHFVNETTDPKPVEDQSDPTKEYASADEPGDKPAEDTQTAEAPAAGEDQPFDTAGAPGDDCSDCG